MPHDALLFWVPEPKTEYTYAARLDLVAGPLPSPMIECPRLRLADLSVPSTVLPHMVPTRGPIFIGIDVEGDKLKITLWRDGKRNAMYAPVARDWALQRSLPQAIDEAIAFAQSDKSSCCAGRDLVAAAS